MTIQIRQFAGTQGDFGQEINNFLQKNPTFTIARKDQIVFEDTSVSPSEFKPALLVTFATLDDPIFNPDRAAMPASVPPTLPAQPQTVVPNASEGVCGLVKVSVDSPTPGDCPTVLSLNDPIFDQIAAAATVQFDWDPNSGTSSIIVGSTVVFVLPNNQNRGVIGHVFIPVSAVLDDPILKVGIIVENTGTGPGNVDFTLTARYIDPLTGELLTKAPDETINRIVPVDNVLNKLIEMSFSLDKTKMVEGDLASFDLSRAGSSGPDTFSGDIGVLEISEARGS